MRYWSMVMIAASAALWGCGEDDDRRRNRRCEERRALGRGGRRLLLGGQRGFHQRLFLALLAASLATGGSCPAGGYLAECAVRGMRIDRYLDAET